MGLVDVLDTQIPKEGCFSPAILGVGYQLGKGCLGIQMILVGIKDKADFIEVVPVEFPTINDSMKDIFCLLIGHFFSCLALIHGINLHGFPSPFPEVFTGKETVITLQVKFQTPFMEPIDHSLGIFLGNELVHDHLPVVFHIGTIATNHTIQPNLPELWLHLCPTAACADIDQMTIFSGLANSFHR